jgi:hypothetical protein
MQQDGRTASCQLTGTASCGSKYRSRNHLCRSGSETGIEGTFGIVGIPSTIGIFTKVIPEDAAVILTNPECRSERGSAEK